MGKEQLNRVRVGEYIWPGSGVKSRDYFLEVFRRNDDGTVDNLIYEPISFVRDVSDPEATSSYYFPDKEVDGSFQKERAENILWNVLGALDYKFGLFDKTIVLQMLVNSGDIGVLLPEDADVFGLYDPEWDGEGARAHVLPGGKMELMTMMESVKPKK